MTTLSEVTEVIVDSEHKTAPKSDDGYPLVRTSDIKRGRIDLSKVQRVDDATYKKWTRRATPQTGDLILAREAPVGNVAVVTPGMQPVLGQRTVLLRPDPAIVDSTFLCALLLGDEAQYWMNAVSNGSTVPHLNMADIRSLKLPQLPPLTIQRRVGASIAAFDDLIENNRRRIEILEEMARLLYREWFVHFRFPGHEDVEMVDSELGPIPEGWDVVRLGDVSEVERGLSWDRSLEVESGGTPVLTIPNIGDELRPENTKRLEGIASEKIDRYSVMLGDTLVIGSNGNPERVGQSVWVPAGVEAVFASFLMRVRTMGSVPSELLFRHLSDDRILTPLRSGAVGSTGLRNLRVTAFRESPILRAPSGLESSIQQQLVPMRQLQDNLLSQNRLLREARDLLLPRLVSGELDVSELDLDEVLG